MPRPSRKQAILEALANEHRREMVILRSVGARPLDVFILIVGESTMLTLTGIAAGVALLYGLLVVSQPFVLSAFGLFIAIGGLSLHELMLIVVVGLAGALIGVIPGYRIYRCSLADGMTIRL